MKMHQLKLSLASAGIAFILAACGGGGGGGGSSTSSATSSSTGTTPPAQTITSADVATPAYAAGSAQIEIFNALNNYRQQCGFPALVENTTLDKSTDDHATYMIDNGYATTDTETAGNTGFTGASYLARAVYAGYPSTGVQGWGGAGGGSGAVTATQFGDLELGSWISGVYHSGVVFNTGSIVGIGEAEATVSGTTYSLADIFIVQNTATITNGPLTFPCQGVTGVPYAGVAETPTPPNVSSNGWGAPVQVGGNLTDTITLSSGTMTDTLGNVITLQVLDSATDPNKELKPYQGVAFPANPLSPNTTYSVVLTGTYNGATFTRTFSFTTGNSKA